MYFCHLRNCAGLLRLGGSAWPFCSATMRCCTRGVGAGRWVWGPFLPRDCDTRRYEDLTVLLMNSEILETSVAFVPGQGDTRFLNIRVYDGSRKICVRLSSFALSRLTWRYLTANNVKEPSSSLRTPSLCPAVLQKLCIAVRELMTSNSVDCRSDAAHHSWCVTPSFYEMSKLLIGAKCELFADAINESRVLDSFCSLRPADSLFGSLGSWEDMDSTIFSGAGNPPFDVNFISRLIATCDASVRKNSPYCRLLLLPAAPSYRVSSLCQAGSGKIILTIPSNNLGFKRQSSFLDTNQDVFFPQPLRNQALYVCVWVNAAHHEAFQAPADVENILRAWVMFSCRDPESVIFHLDVIKTVLPPRHRTMHERAEEFVKDL